MNIAVLSCKNIKDDVCLGCHRCLLGFDKNEGEFEREKDTIVEKLKAKAGVEVIEGTHPYRPVQVLGE